MELTIKIICVAFTLAITILAILFGRKTKQKTIVKENVIHHLKAAINYKVSFITKVEDCYYALINLSITNNTANTMEYVAITNDAGMCTMSELEIQNGSRNIGIGVRRYESLSGVRIKAGEMITGYLVYKCTNPECPIDTLNVKADEYTAQINIHTNLIKEETTANRQFDLSVPASFRMGFAGA